MAFSEFYLKRKLVEQIIRYLNFAGKTFLGIITTIILFFFFRLPEGYSYWNGF